MTHRGPAAVSSTGTPGRLRLRGRWLLIAVAATVGCRDDATAEPAGTCGEQDCVVPDSRQQLLEQLGGSTDPMAEALRSLVDDDATVQGGWSAVLNAVGAVMDCDATTERSFVVLSNQELRPKAIVNRCADAPVQASEFFMIFEPDPATDDLNDVGFRVVGWDASASQYRRYQMVPTDDEDRLAVAVEPGFCVSCHGGVAARPQWTPIMNEMTEPWAQWNAEPGFASFAFDEAFPPDTRGPVFEAVADAERLDSAANLEPIVRAALSRVSTARVSSREDAPDLEVAVDLLRPVFCDETVNFVSEIHDSGEINLDAIIDPGLRDAYVAVGSWPWSWVSDINVRIEPPQPQQAPLALVAVRGHAVTAAETSLRSRGVLTAAQLLAVRALDWTHPFASSLRCGLFEDAEARVRAGDTTIAGDDYADNAGLVAALYAETMTLSGASLLTDDEQTVVAIADADDPAVAEALAAGDLAGLSLGLDALGEQIAQHIASFATPAGRQALLDERNRRGCIAVSRYPVAPIIADLGACA